MDQPVSLIKSSPANLSCRASINRVVHVEGVGRRIGVLVVGVSAEPLLLADAGRVIL